MWALFLEIYLLGVVAWLSGFLNVYKEASQVAQAVKNPPTNAGEAGDRFDSLGWEDSPGVGNGNRSSMLAWKIPWTEDPDPLHSIGSQKSRT